MHQGRGTLVTVKIILNFTDCRKLESPVSNEGQSDIDIPSVSAGLAEDEETQYTAMDGDIPSQCARHGFQRHSSKSGLKRKHVPRFGVQLRICSEASAEKLLPFKCRKLDELVERGTRPALVTCFDTAPRVPPITKEILDELDIPRIINNATLRHDMNFEHELQFRPNLEGPERWANRAAAKQYWCALEAELEVHTIFWTHRDSRDECYMLPSIIGENQRRLPVLLATVREILVTLVPDDDQLQVEEVLDADLIMQQVAKGIYNITGLAKWLARTLKAHCAPMRDQWVDRMVRQISSGAERSDPAMMVDGLRELFGILEAMKLDVANHQIRYLRGLLVEDTVNFEHTYVTRRIADGRIDIDGARLWYLRNLSRMPRGSVNRQDGISCFVWALVCQLLECEMSRPWPSTFRFDLHRLKTLQDDVQDFISVELCCKVLEKWHCRLGRGRMSETVKQTLRNSIIAIVGEGPDRWENAVPNLAPEIARMALSHRACKWSKFCRLASHIQTELSMHLGATTQRSSNLDGRRREMGSALFQSVDHLVTKHVHLSPAAILNALVKPDMGPAPTQYSAAARFDDISRRVTHIACLHWKVWGPIVYETVFAREDDMDADLQTARPRSGSRSTVSSHVSTVEEELQTASFSPEDSDSSKSD